MLLTQLYDQLIQRLHIILGASLYLPAQLPSAEPTRQRLHFATEAVKEQVGGLGLGGNLFFQHSCLQRACLFTPWTNHSDNQQWKPGCGEIHGNFAQTFPLSCHTPWGTHVVQMHSFSYVVPLLPLVKFMHLNWFQLTASRQPSILMVLAQRKEGSDAPGHKHRAMPTSAEATSRCLPWHF